MRQFEVPTFYRSDVIARVKAARKLTDPRKRDFSPTTLDFGPVRFKLARHFGFCYGVEQAVEIAYRALEEAAGRRVFLLSEMIHNAHVNADLQGRGVRFLRSTSGEQLIPFDALSPEDVVIVPAFGVSVEVQADLERRGIDTRRYDTTCPFVERVWKRSAQIGAQDYTIVLHGKRTHEETRATFSHARQGAPVVVVRDLGEAERLAAVIRGEAGPEAFYVWFAGCYSEGFDPARDLARIGVVNQTTMLASETAAIAERLRAAVAERYGAEGAAERFADTTDTLCYATNENQTATLALIEAGANLALVVGGFNSSNTSHLVELCEAHFPTYFIRDAADIRSAETIHHFDLHAAAARDTTGWLPARRPLDVVLTAGASCPDALLEEVLVRMLAFFPGARTPAEALADLPDLAPMPS